MGGLKSLNASQIEAIASALAPQNVTPPVLNDRGQQVFACTPGNLEKTPVLKLTNREFKVALFSLLDDFSTSLKSDAELNNTIALLPGDSVVDSRNTLKEQSLLDSQAITQGLFNASFRAGALIATTSTGLQNYPSTNQCLAAATISQSCHQSFVRELAGRAFRRRLDQTEANTLAAQLWDMSLTKNELLQVTFSSIVAMPEFLYKVYNRGNLVSGTTIVQLNAHELASKLSFFITGSPPDSQLRSLADTGQILTESVLSQQVDRLLALPQSRDTIQRLFRESYGYDVFDSFTFDTNYIGAMNTSGLPAAMTQELDLYFTNLVLNQQATFSDLMTSTFTQLPDQRLATIYGVGSTSVTNLPSERAGFLNRAALLTKRSGFVASPIKRGLKVLEHVLCEEVGLPPPDAPTSLPPIGSGNVASTRDRTHSLSEVSGTSCVQCHSKINNLGYPFERFDSFGRLRSSEAIYNGAGQVQEMLPINTLATSLEIAPPAAIQVRDSTELSQQLSTSNRAMMCFAKHLKRFESRLPASASSNCQLNKSLEAMYGSGNQGSIVSAIKALVLSPDFRRWHY